MRGGWRWWSGGGGCICGVSWSGVVDGPLQQTIEHSGRMNLACFGGFLVDAAKAEINSSIDSNNQEQGPGCSSRAACMPSHMSVLARKPHIQVLPLSTSHDKPAAIAMLLELHLAL